MAAEAGLNKAQAEKALEAFMEVTAKALKGGDKVQLLGFGTFAVTVRKARTGRNPITGASIEIPAKKVVKFKASTTFRI